MAGRDRLVRPEASRRYNQSLFLLILLLLSSLSCLSRFAGLRGIGYPFLSLLCAE